MKRISILLVVLITMLVPTGCGSNAAKTGSPVSAPKEPAATGNYNDGTYEGSSDAGKHPGLKVSVDVKDGKISAVNVIEQHETEGVGTAAFEKLPALIIEAQSTEVDSITGATLSSTALKEAVDKSLAQAKK